MSPLGLSQVPASVSNPKIDITLRAVSKASSIKAYADVHIQFTDSTLEIFGLSVVKHDPEKPAWVSFPQRAGKNGNKYFPIVSVSGALREKICAAVLNEFERTPKPVTGPERVSDSHEPGDDETSF